MEKIANTSLFDYLGKAAGASLGMAVYQAATRAKSPIAVRQVSTRKYTGKIVLYTKEFLDDYFKVKNRLTSTKSTNMNETSNSWLTASGGTATLTNSGYSGNINTLRSTGVDNSNANSTITIAGTGTNSGVVLQGNSTIRYSSLNLTENNMRPTQVKVAVFTITRDEDTNEINSSTFLKEFWVEQKNGVSIDLIVAKQLDKDFDPEFTVIKVLSTVSF